MPRCANPDCGFPDTPCMRRAEFYDPEADCPDLRAGASMDWSAALMSGGGDGEDEHQLTFDAGPRPPGRFWTGLALGSHESFPTLVDNPPVVITAAGREATGKTCLLVAQYLRIATGCPDIFPYRFVGSRTLRGWEQLSGAAFSWTGGVDDKIVPRTNLGSHREPSFLHLAIRQRVKPREDALYPEVTDVIITDMPGEWFYRWSQEVAYEKNLPFLPRTDVFWVIVDAPRLVTDRRADRDALDLLNRTLDYCKDGRPVALIMTQIDLVPVPPPEEFQNPRAWGALGRPLGRLLERLGRHTGPTAFYPVSAFPGPGGAPPIGVIDPLRIAIERRNPPAPPAVPRTSNRYFHQFRELGR